MEKMSFKEIVKKPVVLLIAGALIGLILGLVIGWVIWPVQWTDASAENLRPDLQRDFLRGSILAFDKSNDQAVAIKAYQELGKNAELTLSEVSTDLGTVTTEQVLKFSQAVSAESAVIDVVPEQTAPAEQETPANGLAKTILTYGLICLGVLLIGAALVYFLVLRNKTKAKTEPLTPIESIKSETIETPKKKADVSIPGQVKPVAQFITTYMFGDDLYDDSFSIDTVSGEFLGECGVGISDIIGVGEPKKISAIEVWLFDKNDVQTVTKVLMSEHIFDEPSIRQKLESKGELVLAEPGKQILLETATLQLEARIVDMSYGDIPLPENSYFQRFTLELAIWAK